MLSLIYELGCPYSLLKETKFTDIESWVLCSLAYGFGEDLEHKRSKQLDWYTYDR